MTVALALLLSGSAVAEDRVHLELAWPEDVQWRVVETWRVDTVGADGSVTSRSGVVKGLWAVDHADGGVALELRDPMAARITPRNETRTRMLAARVLQPWRWWVVEPPAPEPETPAAAPAPEVEPAPAADPSAEEAGAEAAEGASAEETAPAAAPEPAPAPAAPVVAVPAPPADPLVAALDGDPAVRFDRVVAAFAGRAVPVGTPERVEEDGAVLEVSARPLPWCPDEGPGSSCVELVVVRATGGAPLEGEVTTGARSVATWVVEPRTLLPHGGRVETVVAGGAEGPAQSVTATREVVLLPAVQPAPLSSAP